MSKKLVFCFLGADFRRDWLIKHPRKTTAPTKKHLLEIWVGLDFLLRSIKKRNPTRYSHLSGYVICASKDYKAN